MTEEQFGEIFNRTHFTYSKYPVFILSLCHFKLKTYFKHCLHLLCKLDTCTSVYTMENVDNLQRLVCSLYYMSSSSWTHLQTRQKAPSPLSTSQALFWNHLLSGIQKPGSHWTTAVMPVNYTLEDRYPSSTSDTSYHAYVYCFSWPISYL